MPDLIDVHVHYDDREHSAHGIRFAAMDIDAFVDAMDRHGVRAACLCAGARLILEETRNGDGLDRANEALFEVCHRHRGRLFAYLLVHPTQLTRSLQIIEHHAADPHVIGIGELLPEGHFHGHSFATPEMREIALSAADRGLPLNIHTGDERSLDQATWLMDQVPRTSVILAHAAGRVVAKGLAVLAERPNVWMDLSAHGWKPGIRDALLASRWKHRFMFGSDVPICSIADAVAGFAGMGFDPPDSIAIGTTNAERLFTKLRMNP